MTAGWRLAAGLALVCAAGAQTLDYSPASPTAGQIDRYLTGKHSPMAGTGAAFASYARDYEIDPRLVVAISGAETTFGKHVCAENNAWNWFHHRTCPQSPFAGYPEGAERVTKFLRLNYLNKGYDSIELIQHKYCASGCTNWIPLVTDFFNEMPANAAPPPPPVQPTGVVQPPPSAPAANRAETPPPPSPKPAGQADEIEGQLEKRVFGVPMYVILLAGVVAVGFWAVRGLPK